MNAPRSASLGQKAAADRSRWLAAAGGQIGVNRVKLWGAWHAPAGKRTTRIPVPVAARQRDKFGRSFAAGREPGSRKSALNNR